MKQGTYPPHPILTDYIEYLWTSERNFRTPQDVLQVLPDSYIELIFSYGAPSRIDDGDAARELPRCYLVGLLDKPFHLRAQGLVKTVAARFYAWGFYPLLGRDIAGAPNAVRPLADVWEPLADQIEHAVFNDDAEGAVEILHNDLIERALTVQFDENSRRAASRLLSQEHAQVTISALADYCHLSRRQLERRFKTSLGETPKALVRRIRFEKVRDELMRVPAADLAALAHDHGYSDQAHFNREFKRFSNRTPAQFASEMLATREILRAFDVAFVQYI